MALLPTRCQHPQGINIHRFHSPVFIGPVRHNTISFGLAIDSALLDHLEQALDGVVVVARFGAWLREELSDTMLALLVGNEFFAEDDGIQFLFLLWIIGWNSLEVDRSLPQCLDQVVWLALTAAIVGSTVACCHCVLLVFVVV